MYVCIEIRYGVYPIKYAHSFVVFCIVVVLFQFLVYPYDVFINVHQYYSDVIMGAMVSQIASLAIVYSTVNSGADQRKHQCSVSLALVRGIHRWLVNSPHKWPVKRKIFPSKDCFTDTGRTKIASFLCEVIPYDIGIWQIPISYGIKTLHRN